MPSRRAFIASTLGLASAAIIQAASAKGTPVEPNEIIRLFDRLPGNKAIRIVAPATDHAAPLSIALNAGEQLFVGSAIKVFVLGEALQQADSPDVVKTLRGNQLTLDERVWSVDSATFNPPHLAGTVSERTTLEAMINHSDNTATDMMLKYAGPDRVRAFVASAGLRATLIPDSTRSFFGYLLGAADYKTFTWAELQAASASPIVNSPLNRTETLASSADDLVSYYSRALQGEFFKNSQTAAEFRRILTLGDVISIIPFPLGTSGFAKGGSIDVKDFHCLCVPGGIYFDGRWVYFAFIINWFAEAETDPATVAAFANSTRQALDLIYRRLSA